MTIPLGSAVSVLFYNYLPEEVQFRPRPVGWTRSIAHPGLGPAALRKLLPCMAWYQNTLLGYRLSAHRAVVVVVGGGLRTCEDSCLVRGAHIPTLPRNAGAHQTLSARETPACGWPLRGSARSVRTTALAALKTTIWRVQASKPGGGIVAPKNRHSVAEELPLLPPQAHTPRQRCESKIVSPISAGSSVGQAMRTDAPLQRNGPFDRGTSRTRQCSPEEPASKAAAEPVQETKRKENKNCA
ncbi:hypothetical protein EV126DRAFT_411242, partial [Verticillium dahliae]